MLVSSRTSTRNDHGIDLGTTTPGTGPKIAHNYNKLYELVQIQSKWNVPGIRLPLKLISQLSRRKATSLQLPSVRRATEPIAVAKQVPLKWALDKRIQLQFNRFPSSRAFL
uniref:(northern house mosquito) hypothetical protein n=1 Tax=Culex pipiens TaxID=7175 RepID=A0A8D8G4Y7_CULPI